MEIIFFGLMILAVLCVICHTVYYEKHVKNIQIKRLKKIIGRSKSILTEGEGEDDD